MTLFNRQHAPHSKLFIIMLMISFQVYIIFSISRINTVTQEECQFVTEKECLPLEKEKCKDFPELICEVVNVTATQQQCQEAQDRQVGGL